MFSIVIEWFVTFQEPQREKAVKLTSLEGVFSSISTRISACLAVGFSARRSLNFLVLSVFA